MNKQDKPRICEVLGVEAGEVFAFENASGERYGTVWVDSIGSINFWVGERKGYAKLSGDNVCYIINHPESIVRRKRFTAQEVEDAKAIKRIFLNANSVKRVGDITVVLGSYTILNDATFPSIGDGESYTLDEIIGEG